MQVCLFSLSCRPVSLSPGSMDPFLIHVWSLQSGQLLEVLAGHEGPISHLDFAAGGSQLCSGSWDGTMKIWDVYKSECVDTLEHGCDVLCVAFRPDGREACTCTTNGESPAGQGHSPMGHREHHRVGCGERAAGDDDRGSSGPHVRPPVHRPAHC